MQECIEEFRKRGIAVIAVSQEDADLESHGKFLKHFGDDRGFEIVADLGRQVTPRYGRTTTYYIDKDGVVREIFPATVRMRPAWSAVLSRIDELQQTKD